MIPTAKEVGIFSGIMAVMAVLAAQDLTDLPFILSAVLNGFLYIGTLFHEIGHTIFFWLYGYPALPMFDFTHGGGYAVPLAERAWPFQYFVWAAFLYGLWHMFSHGAYSLMIPFGVFAAFIFTTSLGEEWHNDVILFMGHGVEGGVAGFMLVRGLCGIYLTRPAERWLNVVIGGFIFWHLIFLAWGVMYDPLVQMEYAEQKGALHMGDLSRVRDAHDWDSINPVAWALLVWVAAMPIAIWALIWVYLRPQEAFIDHDRS